MPVARARCAKRPGHKGPCLTQRTLDMMRIKQQAKYATRNAVHIQAWIDGGLRGLFIDHAKRHGLEIRAAMEQAITLLIKNEDTL